MPIHFEKDLTLEDIEVTLPDTSVVWLEPRNGLNVIYGKNGTGKSSVIASILAKKGRSVLYLRDVLNAKSENNLPLAECLVWLSLAEIIIEKASRGQSDDLSDYLEYQENFESVPPSHAWSSLTWPQQVMNTAGFDVVGIPTQAGRELLLQSLASVRKDWVEVPEASLTEEEAEWEKELLVNIEEALKHTEKLIQGGGTLPTIFMRALNSQEGKPLLLSRVRSAINEAIFGDLVPEKIGGNSGVDGASDSSDVVSILESGHRVSFRTGPLTEIFGNQIDPIEVLVEQKSWHLRGLMSSECSNDSDLPHFAELGGELPDSGPLSQLFTEPEEVIETFKTAIRDLVDEGFVALERSEDQIKWTPGYAIRVPETLDDVSSDVARVFFSRIRACTSSPIVDGPDVLAGCMYLDALGMDALSWIDVAGPKYLLVKSFDAVPMEFPLRIINLSETPDFSAIASGLSKVAMKGATLMLTEGDEESEDSIVMPGLPAVEAMLAEANKMLKSLEVGLTKVHLLLNTCPSGFFERQQAELRFGVVEQSDLWLDYESLSLAQQRWVNILLNILLNLHVPRHATLFVCDEPDMGVHQGAARQVLEFLAELPIPTIVTSHSAVSFQIDRSHLVHLSVENPDERPWRVISEPVLSDDVARAATQLGVSTLDLLALKRLLVVGEGEHDVAVIEGLIGLTRDSKIRQRSLITAARGARNLLSTVEARIITDYTDMHVLSIADNIRAARIAAARDKLLDGEREGLPPARNIKLSGLIELRQDSRFEERVLFDLLERCAQRRILDRFHIFGLGKKDVIEYLPAASFGLSDGWKKLRVDFDNFRGPERQDFKDWLRRERGAEISTRRIRSAFDSLDVIDSELLQLLSEIEIRAAVSALR